MFEVGDLVTICDEKLEYLQRDFEEFYEGYIQKGYAKVFTTHYYNGKRFFTIKVVQIDRLYNENVWAYEIGINYLEHFNPKHIYGELSERLKLFMERGKYL